MTWTQILIHQRGRNHIKGWLEYPAMRVGKGTVSFNTKAAEAYGLKSGDFVSFYIDRERGRVGIKCINGIEDQERFGFKLRFSAKKGSKGKSGTVVTGCTMVAKRFPDCVGRAFRLQLNTGERIIEADMSPDNRLGARQ